MKLVVHGMEGFDYELVSTALLVLEFGLDSSQAMDRFRKSR